MLRLGHIDYPLCLLDTNAVSAMLKNRDREFAHYLAWSESTTPMFVPAFSLFTIIELRRSPAVYRAFLEVFSVIPCVVVKSLDQLIAEEVAAYPDPTGIDPCLVGFAGPLAEASLEDVLNQVFDEEDSQADERKWNDARQEVVDGIASLVSNYLPAAGAYTPEELRRFIQFAGYSQIAMRHFQFAKELAGDVRELKIDAFPSVKAATFTVFYKFYADRTRRPLKSDAFDIIISSATPYVEAIITESHQAEALKKMKRRDSFMDGVRVFPLRDFRDGAPSADP